MSEPTRYYPAGDGVVRTDPKGPLINHYYYEEIKAEVARLKAEVERLTKAGDAMAAHIERNDERCYIVLPDGDIRISEWNAAKEGKQS